MEMVNRNCESVTMEPFQAFFLLCFFFRSSKQWANRIILDAFAAVSAMSVWMEFHLPLMWIIKSIVSMIITQCLRQNALAVEKVSIKSNQNANDKNSI